LISRPEMDARPELFRVMDSNNDGSLDEPEVARITGRIARAGVDLCPDDFLGRWDLDNSGKIEPDELAPVVRLRLRSALERL